MPHWSVRICASVQDTDPGTCNYRIIALLAEARDGASSTSAVKSPAWRFVMVLAINDTAPDFEAETTEGGLNVWGVSFTSLEQRGIPLYRSACARKPRPPFRADKFQSLDARRLVQQTAMCPGNPLAYPQPSLESFDFR